MQEGIEAGEIGLIVRSASEIRRARAAAKIASVRFVELGDKMELEAGAVSIATMHLAKGLEFRSMVVMACDEEIVPQSERIENASDEADLEDIYDTERHLLYVACTRARDHLLITGVTPTSEFLDDFLTGSKRSVDERVCGVAHPVLRCTVLKQQLRRKAQFCCGFGDLAPVPTAGAISLQVLQEAGLCRVDVALVCECVTFMRDNLAGATFQWRLVIGVANHVFRRGAVCGLLQVRRPNGTAAEHTVL